MSAPSAGRLDALVRRVRVLAGGELGQPALRGSYALLITTALTAGLGLAFWVAAARLLPVEVLGAGSATVAAILTVANLGQLNLYQTAGVLLAGPQVPRRAMTLRLFATVTVSTAVIGVVAVLIAVPAGWFGELAVAPAVFVVCAVAWTWFALKDAVLVGIRRFAAVPVANATYGVLKLAAIVLLAAAVPRESVVAATFLPAALIVPIAVGYILRKLPRADDERARLRVDARFVGVDYLGFGLLQLSTTLLPFLVLLGSGARDAGIFAAVWMIVVMLDVIAHNAGVPLAAEAARDLAQADAVERAVRRRALPLVAGTALLAVVLAHPILALFGAGFTAAAPTLQLMLLASIPRAYTVLAFARLRAHRRVAVIAVCEAAHAVVVVGGCLVLLPIMGLPALGGVWLLAQLALATACALIRRKSLAGRAAGREEARDDDDG